MDLRDRVMAACDSGVWTRAEVAEQFSVSESWIRRLHQRRRVAGTYGPLQGRRGRKPIFGEKDLKRLDELLAAQPDSTLAELREQVGVSCSVVTVFNTLKRLGYRRKKKPCGPPNRIGRTLRASVGHGLEKSVA